MKKIFGIVLALALVLSMSVMATPVAAQSTITCASVTLSNPLVTPVGGPPVLSDYTITFTIQEPVDVGEYIDICFPPDTDPSTVTQVDLYGSTNSLATPIGPPPAPIYSTASAAPELATALFITTLRITLQVGTFGGPGDIAPGTLTVIVYDVTNPTDQCTHTLGVGTTAETCADCPTYEIYAFRIDLLAGWNLISLPVIPDDTAIEVVLKHLIENEVTCCDVFDFKVYYYDCTTWYAYNNGSYASLTTMEECKAYWIWVEDIKSFYVKGEYYPDPPGPPLKKCYHECWNMVGFTSDIPREPFNDTSDACCGGAGVCLSPYFGSLAPPGTIVYVLRWDAGLQRWGAVIQAPPTGVPAPNANCLVPGEGYWVAFSADACFVPPPPGV